jgi:hypothetical protein
VRRSSAVLLLLCTLAACEKPPPPAPPSQSALPEYGPAVVEPGIETDNLLDITTGAAVVSRSGDLTLDFSAVYAIDGMLETGWVSAPGASDETLVFSLLAPSRVKQAGLTAAVADQRPESVRFEGSIDGVRWHELATLKVQNTNGRQLAEVSTQTTAASKGERGAVRFIRVHAFTPNRYYIAARTFHILGEEVEPPQPPPFTGCWTINGTRAHITQNGARITGVIESHPPTFLDGGTNNRVAPVLWTRGASWGYAALTRSNDGRQLSGITFNEEISAKYTGEGWYGVRCDDAATIAIPDPAVFLARSGRYSLFGLVFDANERLVEKLSAPALDAAAKLFRNAPGQRFRVTSREFRFESDQLNARHAGARLMALRNALKARGVDTSRLELVAAGNHWIGPPIRSQIQLLMASRIDIETVGR